MKRALAIVAVLAGAARADDKATAEALFEDGKALVAQGDYTAACPKFEASYKFDPATGTKINLADCYEHVGRFASAWALYKEVEDTTKNLTDEVGRDRAQHSHDHAAALAPRLIRLRIDPPTGAIAGLVVKRDGEDVTAILGTALPVDPGPHAIEASAPGFTPYTTTLTLGGEGATTPFQIPPLVAVETPTTAPAPEPARRLGYGGSLSVAIVSAPQLIFPDNCSIPANGGGSISPAGFADITLAPWLHARTGLRFQILLMGYQIHDNMGHTLCQPDDPPKNLTSFILGPFVQLLPRIAHGSSWDIHALAGAEVAFPLGNGNAEHDDMSTAIPGVSAGSPIQSSLEVGLGVTTHGVFVELGARLFVTKVTDAFDLGNDKLILLTVGYSSAH